MYLISNQETAKEMWECLSEQYEKTDTIHAIALFRQLTTFHMQEGDDFETFLQSWRSLLEQGTTAGLGFTDKQHVVMLLAALPSTWRPFVTTHILSNSIIGCPHQQNASRICLHQAHNHRQQQPQPINNSNCNGDHHPDVQPTPTTTT